MLLMSNEHMQCVIHSLYFTQSGTNVVSFHHQCARRLNIQYFTTLLYSRHIYSHQECRRRPPHHQHHQLQHQHHSNSKLLKSRCIQIMSFHQHHPRLGCHHQASRFHPIRSHQLTAEVVPCGHHPIGSGYHCQGFHLLLRHHLLVSCSLKDLVWVIHNQQVLHRHQAVES